jgi:hypothetical protein
MSRFQKFQVECICGRVTTKTYARSHGGKCKTCVTGIPPAPRSRSYDSVAREGGYEDTMGVSLDAYEAHCNGGY